MNRRPQLIRGPHLILGPNFILGFNLILGPLDIYLVFSKIGKHTNYSKQFATNVIRKKYVWLPEQSSCSKPETP